MRNKAKGITKGAPSGFVISLAVHAGAFFLAGLLVVFTVTQKEEKKFVPPKPVERPKMKLKKPKVKVKKSAKPKSTQRIVTKVQRANMPDIQLPEMSGIGDGLGSGMGSGFDLMPDLGEVTVFGAGMTIGNDFVGTFYDLKRSRQGRKTIMETDQFVELASKFIRGGWRPSVLSRFYRSPKKLYATTFMVPTTRSYVAPRAFGEADTIGWCWLAHYKGQLVHEEGITFRFWGQGDDILVVRVNGEIVLNASWPGTNERLCRWHTSDSKNRTYKLGNNYSVPGDWITLEPGESIDMEVLIGEVPGGSYDAMLLVEEEGVDYERNSQSGPILPIFKTEQPSHDLLDILYEWMVPGEACLTNGPVFCDFSSSGRAVEKESAPVEPQLPEVESQMRVWSLAKGRSVEGEFISLMGDKVIVKTPKGKQLKISKDQVSDEDLEYITLSKPPKFKINFSKQVKSAMNRYPQSPYELQWGTSPPRVNDYTFGVKVKNSSAQAYDYELTAEYYAIGTQKLDDRKYKLLDRGTTTFNLGETRERSHEYKNDKEIELIDFDLDSQIRGTDYYGYLIVLRDKRGEIIQHAASNEWLYDHYDDLQNIPVNAYMNKQCERVYPTGPKRQY